MQQCKNFANQSRNDKVIAMVRVAPFLTHSFSTEWFKKTRPLCLTAHIFKTYEPICVIFGRLQRYFALNTSVNCIFKKFITQVVPPSDKIKNLVFHLQNHLRPLYLDHFCKILALIFPNFGTVQQHDILNMSVNFIFIQCLYKIMPPGKKQIVIQIL